MKFQYVFVFLVLVSLISSCNQQQAKVTRGSETVVGVSEEDVAMNVIIDNARKSIPVFLKAIQDPDIDKYEASVKYPFETDPGSENKIEHIWITNISFENGQYHGLIANTPFYIKGMKLGDRIQFDMEKISDWKYLKDGYLYGGKSIKYFYDGMTNEEKKDFDKKSRFKFKQ